MKKPFLENTLFALVVLFAPKVAGEAVFDSDLSGNLSHQTLIDSYLAPSVTTQSSEQDLKFGQDLSLSVQVTNVAGPVSFQWLLNGELLSAATNLSYFSTNIGAGNYSVIVSNAVGVVTSQVARVRFPATTNALRGLLCQGQSSSELWLAVGDKGTILTSSNALVWTPRVSPTTNDITAICQGNGILVATSATRGLVSSNGIVWYINGLSSFSSVLPLKSILYTNNIYLAAGHDGVYYSTNANTAANWFATGFTSTQKGYFYNAVAAGNGYFVAVGANGSFSAGVILYSTTGRGNWTTVPASDIANPEPDQFLDVAFGNGHWVAVGDNGGIYTSFSALPLIWNLQESGVQLQNIRRVQFFNGLFHVFGQVMNKHICLVSPDGLRWVIADERYDEDLYGAASDGSRTFAVGAAGAVREVPPLAIHHFTWSPITNAPVAGVATPVSVTAKDVFDRTVTNFNELVSFRATKGNPATNMAMGYSSIGSGGGLGDYTLADQISLVGTQITIFQLRTLYGTKATLWNTNHGVVFSQKLQSPARSWTLTPMREPVVIQPGTYKLGLHTDGGAFYNLSVSGTPSSWGVGDEYPYILPSNSGNPSHPAGIYFNDFVYALGASQPVDVSPALSGTFVQGVWTGHLASVSAGLNVMFQAVSSDGVTGFSNPFNVATNFLTPPQLLANGPNFGFSSNHFGFTVSALPGQAVVIEASTNLVNWVPVNTNLVGDIGTYLYSDLQSELYPRRYYRARLYQGALPPPAILVSSAALNYAGGSFGFNVSGVPGRTVVVEYSTNLFSWLALQTNTFVNNLYSFVDTASTNFPRRFFRLRPEGTITPSPDFAENNASQWGTFASDSAVASVSNSIARIQDGEGSLLFSTGSGFDTGVTFPVSTNMNFNAAAYSNLVFWEYPENTNAFSWQGNQPVIIIRTSTGDIGLTPTSQMTTNFTWSKLTVPLAGGSGWTRTISGSPNLSNVTQIQIHHDTWDFGFRIWLDGVRFTPASP